MQQSSFWGRFTFKMMMKRVILGWMGMVGVLWAQETGKVEGKVEGGKVEVAKPKMETQTQVAAVPGVGMEWVDARGSAAMEGATAVMVEPPMELVWQVSLMEKVKRGEMLVASAVIRGGKVYVGCKEGTFHCLDLATGKSIWVAKTLGAIDGAAAFAGDQVMAGSQDGFVYGWNAETGVEKWKFETEAEIHAAANVWTPPGSMEARVYIGSYDYSVYCLDALTGKKLWAAETGYYINGGAAIGDGKVVFGGCDSVLHVHDAVTGVEVRQIEVGAYIGNNVAIADGIIYVSHYGNRVGAYSMEDGMKVWEYGEREFEYYAAPALHQNWLVVGGRDKRVHGINRTTGKGIWEFRARDRVDSSAVICGGKHVVVGSDDGYVYLLRLEDGTEVWNYEIGAPVKTSPAVTGEWVVVGADDGVLYGFRHSRGVGGEKK
jgi:outer membrane protein assembly factor BamB